MFPLIRIFRWSVKLTKYIWILFLVPLQIFFSILEEDIKLGLGVGISFILLIPFAMGWESGSIDINPFGLLLGIYFGLIIAVAWIAAIWRFLWELIYYIADNPRIILNVAISVAGIIFWVLYPIIVFPTRAAWRFFIEKFKYGNKNRKRRILFALQRMKKLKVMGAAACILYIMMNDRRIDLKNIKRWRDFVISSGDIRFLPKDYRSRILAIEKCEGGASVGPSREIVAQSIRQ